MISSVGINYLEATLEKFKIINFFYYLKKLIRFQNPNICSIVWGFVMADSLNMSV